MTNRTGRVRRRDGHLAAIVVVALVGCTAGCGDGAVQGDGGRAIDMATTTMPRSPEPGPVVPVTVRDAAGRSVTVRSAERIIPLDGDLAEIVFALGLGDKVVATDLSATYPPQADALPEIGYQRSLTPEPILAFSPTVMLATSAAGPAEVIDQLRAAAPVVLVDAPPTLDGPAAKIRAVAAALGVPARGEALARQVQGEIDAAVASVPKEGAKPRVAALYLRGDRVQQVFGPGSGIHAVLDAAGATDIGELLGVKDNAAITTESMIRERPDVLVVTTTGLESVGGVDELLALPAFSRTPVAQSKKVLVFETQYLYGSGPRTGRLLTEIVQALHAS